MLAEVSISQLDAMTMQNYVSLSILCLCLTACGTEADSGLETHEGLYSAGFERSAFQPCGLKEEWWADFRTRNPDDFFKAMGTEFNADWESQVSVQNRFLRVRGRVERVNDPSPPGDAGSRRSGYGHMGQYAGQIAVHELLEARDATEAEMAECRGSD
tara:strand:+ start:230 stop:703 length:474 start_codon:yes stop_codon:yes gene_type:complete